MSTPAFISCFGTEQVSCISYVPCPVPKFQAPVPLSKLELDNHACSCALECSAQLQLLPPQLQVEQLSPFPEGNGTVTAEKEQVKMWALGQFQIITGIPVYPFLYILWDNKYAKVSGKA